MSAIADLGRLLTKNTRQSGMLIALIAIVAYFSILNSSFLSPTNLTNIVLQYSYILILAIGMLMVILLGQIDLSVGSVVAFTGAVSAVLVIKNGHPWWVGVMAALLVGVLVGVWQGFWVAVVGIPGFIVTLAGMLLFRGMTYLVLEGVSLAPFAGTYYSIANGFLKDVFPTGGSFDLFTMLIFVVAVIGFALSKWRARRGKIFYKQEVEFFPLFLGKIVVIGAAVLWFGYQLSVYRGLPIVLIILTVLVLVYSMITQRTVFGRHIYAIGGNLNAAELSGVRVRKVKFWVYVNMGFLASLAGVVFTSRMNGAQPIAGNMFELDAIAACFVGGASTTGGIGRVGGAIIGGLVMAVMSNGMQLQGVSSAWQQVVKGVVLLLAVAYDMFNRKRASLA